MKKPVYILTYEPSFAKYDGTVCRLYDKKSEFYVNNIKVKSSVMAVIGSVLRRFGKDYKYIVVSEPDMRDVVSAVQSLGFNAEWSEV